MSWSDFSRYPFVENFLTGQSLQDHSHTKTLNKTKSSEKKNNPSSSRPGSNRFTRKMISYYFGTHYGAASNFTAHKELIVLNILKYKYCVNRSRDISRDHFAKNLKKLTNWWRVWEKKSSDNIFLIHIQYLWYFSFALTVHCASIKITTANIILNALINLELFNTLILNFAYILSKRGKLGMFIFHEKSHFIYPNKVNSPVPFIFNFWSRN